VEDILANAANKTPEQIVTEDYDRLQIDPLKRATPEKERMQLLLNYDAPNGIKGLLPEHEVGTATIIGFIRARREPAASSSTASPSPRGRGCRRR
jgi:hypothetical protein